jgi:hypothetical protein
MNRAYGNAPHWKDEQDWLCTVEFLRKDDPEARVYTSEIIGYLVGYAHLANARTLHYLRTLKTTLTNFCSRLLRRRKKLSSSKWSV